MLILIFEDDDMVASFSVEAPKQAALWHGAECFKPPTSADVVPRRR